MRSTIKGRLLSAAIAIVVLFSVFFAVNFLLLRFKNAINAEAATLGSLKIELVQTRAVFQSFVAAGQVFVLVGTEGLLKTIDQKGGASAIEREGVSIARAAQVPSTQVEEFQKALGEWQSQFAAVRSFIAAPGRFDEISAKIDGLFDDFLRHIDAEIAKKNEQQAAFDRINLIILSVSGALLVLLIAFVIVYVDRSVIRRIKQTTNCMAKMSQGDLDVHLPRMTGNDEIAKMVQ